VSALDGGVAGVRFGHLALFYSGAGEYVASVGSFVREGTQRGEPALVAVPAPRLSLLRDCIDGSAGAVEFVDMEQLGRNPARIIPAIRRFTDAHRGRTRFVGEPIWPGRSPAEVAEATRHEGLINVAFAGAATTILCPYDERRLDEAVLDEARATHPDTVHRGQAAVSPHYSGLDVAQAIGEHRPDCPPPDADAMSFAEDDLPDLRHFTRECALRAGLGASAVADLVMAVNEAATNTVVHARSGGVLRIWRDPGAVICEVSDQGRITDPLVGRHLRPTTANGGHGLRVVNEVCDLVELRSGKWGTAVRMHVRCGRP
jgi:anti-sigma regulatory factor (Ser/Thr protein kinase)